MRQWTKSSIQDPPWLICKGSRAAGARVGAAKVGMDRAQAGDRREIRGNQGKTADEEGKDKDRGKTVGVDGGVLTGLSNRSRL